MIGIVGLLFSSQCCSIIGQQSIEWTSLWRSSADVRNAASSIRQALLIVVIHEIADNVAGALSPTDNVLTRRRRGRSGDRAS